MANTMVDTTQLVNNVNTLVAISDYTIKVSVNGQDWYLQGIVTIGGNNELALKELNGDGWVYLNLTQTLLNSIVLQALSQVNLFDVC